MSIYNITTSLTTNNPKPYWQYNDKIVNTHTRSTPQKTNIPGTVVPSSFSQNRFVYGSLIESSANSLSNEYNDSLLIKYDNYLEHYNHINKAKILKPFQN